MAHTTKQGPEASPPAELRHGNADDVTRHSFRGPVSGGDHITVRIAGSHHAVADIGSRGIGILLTEGTALVPGQSHDLLLALGNKEVSLRGIIRHVTRDDETGGFHCGIQLLDLTPEIERQLQEFVLRQRHHLFPKPPA
ncbi:MAG: PilZ domain-containing protein [Thermodesulfobacteriota bacterium]